MKTLKDVGHRGTYWIAERKGKHVGWGIRSRDVPFDHNDLLVFESQLMAERALVAMGLPDHFASEHAWLEAKEEE